MFNLFYNFFLITPILYFLTKEINFKYFKLNNKHFLITISYHLCLTVFFVFLFKDQPADYKMYLELKHIKPFSFKHSFATTEMIYNFIYLLKNMFFFSDYNIIFLFSLISYFGILIFIKNLIKLGIDKEIALLLFFIPGIHIWTSLPGKDCFILFLSSCFFYMYIDKRIFFSLIFVFLIFLIRPQIGIIFFLSLAIAEFFFIKGHKKIIILIISLVAFYLYFNSGFASGYLVDKHSFSENIIIKMFSKLSEISQKFSNSATSYQSSNIYFNIFNYILFPLEFTFKNNSLLINLTIMLETLTLIYVLILISAHRQKIYTNKKLIYFLTSFSLIYLMILPQVLFNFGLNIRQKWMIIPFLIYLIFLLKNLIVKIKKI